VTLHLRRDGLKWQCPDCQGTKDDVPGLAVKVFGCGEEAIKYNYEAGIEAYVTNPNATAHETITTNSQEQLCSPLILIAYNTALAQQKTSHAVFRVDTSATSASLLTVRTNADASLAVMGHQAMATDSGMLLRTLNATLKLVALPSALTDRQSRPALETILSSGRSRRASSSARSK